MATNIVEISTDLELKQVVKISNQSLLDFSRLTDKNYVTYIQKNGFFIAPYNLEELRKDKNKILLGIKEQNKIVAYIWISVFFDDHQYDWLDKNVQTEISNQKIYKLKGIGVFTSYQGKGLASKLLKQSTLRLKDKSIKYLVSTVANYPVRNSASIAFHEKNGFQKVAVSPKVSYYGFDKYQCVLFAKKVN
jgi:ribosomal protein S18 acetylase RimI-like enzyme